MFKYILIPMTAILFMSGCSNRESILVPGQTESDCEDQASSLGVCGTPKSVYAHRDKIKNLWFEEDQAYFIKQNGKIYNVDTREEVKVGVKPEGDAICPGCEDNADDGEAFYYENDDKFSWSRKKNRINLQSRALVIKSPQKASMIRDLGWQQKIWIAPLETRGGDLIEAHGLHVVIKEPSWIIGEKAPRKVSRGVVITSPFAKEALTDNLQAIDRTTNRTISDYVNGSESNSLKTLKKYIESQKDKEDVKDTEENHKEYKNEI